VGRHGGGALASERLSVAMTSDSSRAWWSDMCAGSVCSKAEALGVRHGRRPSSLRVRKELERMAIGSECYVVRRARPGRRRGGRSSQPRPRHVSACRPDPRPRADTISSDLSSALPADCHSSLTLVRFHVHIALMDRSVFPQRIVSTSLRSSLSLGEVWVLLHTALSSWVHILRRRTSLISDAVHVFDYSM